ncbi:MAG: hypothetical protein Q4G30_10355 [Actinomycetaceae bacterium]|nr:hypothetical protein [Actinomycetaceae bacterium]
MLRLGYPRSWKSFWLRVLFMGLIFAVAAVVAGFLLQNWGQIWGFVFAYLVTIVFMALWAEPTITAHKNATHDGPLDDFR